MSEGRDQSEWSRPSGAHFAFAVVIGILIVGVWMLKPYFEQKRSVDHRIAKCGVGLKILALALHNYHDAYGSFPPAYIADANGKPMHSWRVLILPFLEQQIVYNDYRFEEPWDSPHNLKLVDQIYNYLYHCPSDTSPFKFTSYVAVVGEKTVWPGTDSIALHDIRDGTTCTVMLVEYAGRDIVWTEPRDLEFDTIQLGINPATPEGISSAHEGGANFVLCDGKTRFLKNDTDPNLLRKLLERNDGESLDEF